MSMSSTVAIYDVLEQLRDACYKNSKDKGFWDEREQRVIVDGAMGPQEVIHKAKPWNLGEKIALIHSELSEMFEAWRKNVKESDKDIQIIDPLARTTDDPIGYRRITAIEEEVADVIIRVLDLCGKLDIDVGRVVLAKMMYNKNRPYMHGGRQC